jgi:hypothetical protein
MGTVTENEPDKDQFEEALDTHFEPRFFLLRYVVLAPVLPSGLLENEQTQQKHNDGRQHPVSKVRVTAHKFAGTGVLTSYEHVRWGCYLPSVWRTSSLQVFRPSIALTPQYPVR